MTRACRECLTRTWLLARLGGHLDVVRSQIGPLLALPDDELLRAVAGRRCGAIERERRRFDTAELAGAARAAGVEMVCRCDGGYPSRLRDLEAPPAVLHVAGGLERLLSLAGAEPVAIVGARRASVYGLEMARSLGRGLAASGVAVVSGMARGIDTAAHQGALEPSAHQTAQPSARRIGLQAGAAIAVLPGPAERPYPAGQRGLYRQVTAAGVAVSELPCGAGVRRWSFLARNRIIAGLAELTVVVEATERSGTLPTAETARQLGRRVGAVPGRVTTAQAAGPNALLAVGATVVRGVQDVLDCLYGVGTRAACDDGRTALDADQLRVLRALDDGQSAAGALRVAGIAPERGLALLSELEIGGWVRRGPGGSLTVIP
jgi:DNA processing protein